MKLRFGLMPKSMLYYPLIFEPEGSKLKAVYVEDLRAWLKGAPQDMFTKEELCEIHGFLNQNTPDFKNGFIAGEHNIKNKLLAELEEAEK